MKISIIGAGNIGGTLGEKWAATGHTVVFGVRDPQGERVQARLAQMNGRGTAVAIPDAAIGADVVLFAVPGQTMAANVNRLDATLNGKILIDATNKVGSPEMHSLPLLRAAAPDSAIFRAFANLGWENFAEPQIGGQTVDLFYCGDTGTAQQTVHGLIAGIGLHPIYVGDHEQIDVVDNLTRLWFVLALQRGRGRHLAFKMLTE